MTRSGRPLRFLGTIIGGWVVLRAGLLWPTLEVSRDLIRLFVPPAAAAVVPRVVPPVARPYGESPPSSLPVAVASAAVAAAVGPAGPRRASDPAGGAGAPATVPGVGRDQPIEEAGAIPPPLRPTPADPARRLSAGAWSIVRGGIDAALPGGQLGGSQAGVRIAYALGGARRVALTARLSTPLAGRGSEAAAGIEYRARGLPLRLVAEQRVALDGGSGGQALYAVGGVAPLPIAAGFRLEGYAQAGIVVRGQAQGFADGAARLTRPLSHALDLGIGAWGGAQPGVARVDVGATLGASLPVARHRIRVSLDWRRRIAGRARPGSGPALSIGSDF